MDMAQDDMVSRVAVGKLAREMLDEYLKAGKPERAMGMVLFCDRLGVVIPNAPMLKLVRQGKY